MNEQNENSEKYNDGLLTKDEKHILQLALAGYINWVDELQETEARDDDARREVFNYVDGCITKLGLDRKSVFIEYYPSTNLHK